MSFYFKLAYEYLIDPTIRYLLDCWRDHATPRRTDLLDKVMNGVYVGFFTLLDSNLGTPEWNQISPNSLRNIEVRLKKIPFIYNIYKLNFVNQDSLILIRFLNLKERGSNMVYFIMINRAGMVLMIVLSGIGILSTIWIVVKLSRHLYKKCKSSYGLKNRGKPEKDK